MKKVIFIHGYTSSPNKKKYRIIAEELDKAKVDYSIPAFPGGENPYTSEWLEIINEEVEKSKNPVILVGHSLGTRAALLYLDKFGKKVDTVILFAAFNNDYQLNRNRKDEHYSDFFDYPINIEKVKNLADKFIVVHSKDDDSIDYGQGKEVARELGAELKTYENMDHFAGEEKAEENAKVFLEVVRSVL